MEFRYGAFSTVEPQQPHVLTPLCHVTKTDQFEERLQGSLHPFHVILTKKAAGRSVFRVLEPICGAAIGGRQRLLASAAKLPKYA